MTRAAMLMEVIEYLQIFFEEEPDKVELWLEAENPMLGSIRPIALIENGRVHKLWQFVLNSREGNLA